MKTLIFDIEAEFAHFKSYEATRGNYSFPFPPRTAILGLIAAITGIQRNSYWDYDHNLRYSNIALEVLNPVDRYGLKVNYTSTRETTSIGLGTDRIILHFPNKPTSPKSRGFITNVRLDLLRNIRYRVYFNASESLLEKLTYSLENRYYIYPPYMGHANLLANIINIGMIDGERMELNDQIKVSGIVPVSSLDQDTPIVDTGIFEIIYNVPFSARIYNRIQRYDGQEVLMTKTDGTDNFLFQTVTGSKGINVFFKKTALVAKYDLSNLSKAIKGEPWNQMKNLERTLSFWPVSPSES